MTPEFQARLAKEFPFVATLGPSEVDRRQFVKLMGASITLAGLAGCVRRSVEKIVPYVVAPEIAIPGSPNYYATAMPVEGFARGIVVESHLGRPTKIEGNPDHPESLGSTDAMTQAAILSLYDPDRSREPRQKGQATTWVDFDAAWAGHQAELLGGQGKGLALLVEPTTSPSVRRELQRILEKFPAAHWYQHTPLAGYEVGGAQPDYDFASADVVLLIGSDCLFRHPASLRYSRAFAGRRRVENGRAQMNRVYALESTPSVTGMLADFRLPASPARIRAVLDALARAITHDAPPGGGDLSPAEVQFVLALAADLHRFAPAVVCVAGAEEDAAVQHWALALNARFGAIGKSVRLLTPQRSDTDKTSAGDLAALSRAITRDEVTHLFVLGSNPVYSAPADLGFADLLGKVPFTVHLGGHVDETAAVCAWHLPESHWLETWSDLRGYDGTATILQPLIEPLYDTRDGLSLLRQVTAAPGTKAYDIVRERWQHEHGESDFDLHWNRWLNAGVVDGDAAPSVAAAALDNAFPVLAHPATDELPFLILQPDPTIGDGRWANNAWLQELPKPLTMLVWDNAALVSPAFAAKLGISSGDILVLSVGQRAVNAAALILPGHAEHCVTLSLGYGRIAAGAVGNGHGFDAYRLRTGAAPWRQPGLRVSKTGSCYPTVTTQQQFAMEGRDLVRVVAPDALSVPPRAASPTMYPPWKNGGHAWGMSIDLSTCLGCNACVVACQAENNIPVVGKDQVGRGRQMHWIRIDTYFSGDPASPSVVHQPVPCMQCENAPCELVCPVGATVHSSEGLNDMVYNRCVGTRYCSNNCPYKVRRFNFFDYRSPPVALIHLQENPDVTVRTRGVMEKCTYCVQRINAACITAEKADRLLRDGEIRTACQQACPAEAIVFGDLSDPGSRVSLRKREPTNYILLEELNTGPARPTLPRCVIRPKGARREHSAGSSSRRTGRGPDRARSNHGVGNPDDQRHSVAAPVSAFLVDRLSRGVCAGHAPAHGDRVAVHAWHRNLGRQYADRVGLRDRELCLVDRHRARWHVHLGDPAATAPVVAHFDQPVHGGDDAIRRRLRRAVSDPAPRPPAVLLLASALSRHDGPLAAVSQPARVGRFCRLHLCDGIAGVLVCRSAARSRDHARPGGDTFQGADLRSVQSRLARRCPPLDALPEALHPAGGTRGPAGHLGAHDRRPGFRHRHFARLAFDDLPPVFCRRGDLFRLLDGPDSDHPAAGRLQAAGADHPATPGPNGEGDDDDWMDRDLRVCRGILQRLAQWQYLRSLRGREPRGRTLCRLFLGLDGVQRHRAAIPVGAAPAPKCGSPLCRGAPGEHRHVGRTFRDRRHESASRLPAVVLGHVSRHVLGLLDPGRHDRFVSRPVILIPALSSGHFDGGSAPLRRDGRGQRMNAPIHGLLAAFVTEASFRGALRNLREAGCVRLEAYTPYPVEPCVLPGARTPIGWIMLLAGTVGASGGFSLQWFAAYDYPLNIGGRPLNSWPAFIPITFELTILTAALVGVFALFCLAGLPRLHHPVFSDVRFKRASQDRFFICLRSDDPLYRDEKVRRTLAEAQPESVAEVRG